MLLQIKLLFLLFTINLMLLSCGYKPIFQQEHTPSQLINNIGFNFVNNKENYLITENLYKHFGYSDNPKIIIEIVSNIEKKSEIITSSNETTSYNLIIEVEYAAYDRNQNKLDNWTSLAKTSYTATSTYTGYATEVAETDAIKRLSETISEEIILNLTVDLINNGFFKN